MLRRSFVLLLAATTACAANSRSFRCEARGGLPWTEYRSQHFLVDTDSSPERAAKLLDKLETLQLLELKALVGGEVEIPGRLRVIALTYVQDFRSIAPENTVGYFSTGQFDEPTVVVPLAAVSEDSEVLAHELAHHLSKYLFPLQPAWYAEGLAQFVQTLAAPAEVPPAPPTGSHFVRVSKVPVRSAGKIPEFLRQGWPRNLSAVPVKQLLAWQEDEDETVPGLHHASAWLLYHWLWNHRSAEFSSFQKRLADGEMPAAAWRAAFPEYDVDHGASLAALDEQLESYRRYMSFVSYAVEGTAQAKFDAHPLSSADAHVIVLSVRARWPSSRQERRSLVESEVTEALREDPRNAVAATYKLDDIDKGDADKFRAAVSKAPGDWRSWLLLSSAIEGAEKEAALRKATQLNPDNPMAQNALAWLLVTSNRAREALPFANRALDLAPWNASMVDTLAEVAAQLGQCAQATQLEQRSVAMRPADEGARKRQIQLLNRCKPGAPSPAQPLGSAKPAGS